jgi:hypothetical protein
MNNQAECLVKIAQMYGKNAKMPEKSVPTKRANNCTKLEKLEHPFQPLFC